MTVLLQSGLMYGCVAPALVRRLASGMLRIEVAEVEDIAFLLGVPLREATPVWEGMKADGWIVHSSAGWRASDNIRELANARIGKALPRKKAEQLIQQVVANAAKMNELPADTMEIFWITKLAVFGSYLDPSKAELGDLDIAFAVAPRIGTKNWAVNRLMYGQDDMSPTRRLLRPKSPYVKLVSMSQMLGLDCPYQTLLEFAPPTHK